MINKPNGSLYIFEGPDNVGKTTIAKSVATVLSKTDSCEYLSFPGREQKTLGKFVYDLHHDYKSLGINKIDETSMQALHIAAHIDCINQRIIPLLKKGISVLLDRYWWSTIVYGELASCDIEVVKQLIEAEKQVWGKIKPSTIFYIKRGFPGAEDSLETQQLVQKYDSLSAREALSSHIVEIQNTDLNESVSSILAGIKNQRPQVKKQHTQGSLIIKIKSESSTSQHPPSSLSKLLGPTVVFDTYWKFAVERQNIFYARLRGDKKPWTDDPILAEHKFTNAYRASDRVSQYLIKNVIYDGSQDFNEVFFRIILFKIFNKIETWTLLEDAFGEVSYETFDFDHYDTVLTNAIESNIRIYSAAYIMPTGGRGTQYRRKHRMHLDLIQNMMNDNMPQKIADASSMGKVFDLLLTYRGIGDFLAYQYATDINYSELTNFTETNFVVPGPGAKDGIRKCFSKTSGLSDAEIIKVVMEHQEEEFDRLGLEFKDLWGRSLRLIDCQNLFCETDKYARVKHPEIQGKTGRSRIKQKFHPNPKPIAYWYPPKWDINERIQAGEQP